MAKSTKRDKRKRAIRLVGFLAVITALAGTIIVDHSLLHRLSMTVLDLARIRTVQLVVGAVVIVIFVVGELLDNADKLRFLLEIFYKALGINKEDIETTNREFNRLPENYVNRPELEQRLTVALQPEDDPRLVILHGARDTGKTTLLHYVTPRGLIKKYRGRVIICRGDRQSVEAGPGDSDEQISRRLARLVFRRVIQRGEVPGDVGETTETMSDAIAEHFLRQEKSWLVIIDQADDALFPFETVLPALYGARNMIVVARLSDAISPAALRTRGEHETVTHIGVAMEPFNLEQALELLKSELRRKHKRVTRPVLRALSPHLIGTSPGIIQRLSDLYQYDRSLEQIDAVGQTLDNTSGQQDEIRTRAIAKLTVSHFNAAEKRFISSLALLDGNTVGAPVLQFLARRLSGDTKKTSRETAISSSASDELIRTCVERGYLRLERPREATNTRQRYHITKLGRGTARVARAEGGVDVELTAGCALLDYYRAVEDGKEVLDLVEEFPNILGIMAWSQFGSRTMPDADVVSFARMLKDTFYESGRWNLGISWLSYAASIARAEDYPCSLGDLLTARAQLTLARGLPGEAELDLAAAKASYERSQRSAESDLELDKASETALRVGITYSQLRQIWVRRLEAYARISALGAYADIQAIQVIAADIKLARDQLAGMAIEPHSPFRGLADANTLALASDLIAVTMLQGEAYDRLGEGDHARQQWSRARSASRSLRALASRGPRTNKEALAQGWRAEGACLRRAAQGAFPVARALRRWRSLTCLRKSLAACAHLSSRYEEALTQREIALITMGEAHAIDMLSEEDVQHCSRSVARRLLVHCKPRWYQLRSALWQLRAANASASALHASGLQVTILVTMTRVSLRLWQLDHDAAHIATARDYAQSARSIVERLQESTPAVSQQLRSLPAWLYVGQGTVSSPTQTLAAVTA